MVFSIDSEGRDTYIVAVAGKFLWDMVLRVCNDEVVVLGWAVRSVASIGVLDKSWLILPGLFWRSCCGYPTYCGVAAVGIGLGAEAQEQQTAYTLYLAVGSSNGFGCIDRCGG